MVYIQFYIVYKMLKILYVMKQKKFDKPLH